MQAVELGGGARNDGASYRASTGRDAARLDARALSREWLAVGAARTDARTFLAVCLVFAAVLWGELVRGAFFRTDLIVFTALAVAAACVMPGAGAALAGSPWLIWSAGSMALAVSVSAVAREQTGSLGFPLAAVAAAAGLAVVGICASQRDERLILIRAVVDAALLTALLGIVGVVQKLPALAELQAEGWRASARIGYANATGVVLALGVLCACWLAYLSGSLGDRVRAWLIMTGLFATQSRGALLGVALCWLAYLVWHRASARILAQTTAWALVAFIGLIPAIERIGPQPGYAVFGAAVALVLLLATARGLPAHTVQALATGVGWSAAVTTAVLLNTRVVDSGSDSGRLRLWHEAVTHLHVTGVFGSGPEQIASFSRGSINQLFVHNDVLQFAQYYGAFGVLALAVTAGCLAVAFVRTRRLISGAAWGLGLGVVLVLACDALVDFPLQVPLLPATAALVLGLTVGSGRNAVTSAAIAVHHLTMEGIAP